MREKNITYKEYLELSISNKLLRTNNLVIAKGAARLEETKDKESLQVKTKSEQANRISTLAKTNPKLQKLAEKLTVMDELPIGDFEQNKRMRDQRVMQKTQNPTLATKKSRKKNRPELTSIPEDSTPDLPSPKSLPKYTRKTGHTR